MAQPIDWIKKKKKKIKKLHILVVLLIILSLSLSIFQPEPIEDSSPLGEISCEELNEHILKNHDYCLEGFWRENPIKECTVISLDEAVGEYVERC